MKLHRDHRDIVGDADIPATVSTSELAEILKISVRNVDMLVTRGVLEKIGPARFDTRAAIGSYLDYARRGGNSALDSEKLRLTRENADKVEIQNATARRELLPAADVEREWSSALRDLRAALLALPARVQTRLPPSDRTRCRHP